MGKRMSDETNLFQHLSRIFGIPTPHRIRTENGWEQDGKALESDWEQVGKYFLVGSDSMEEQNGQKESDPSTDKEG